MNDKCCTKCGKYKDSGKDFYICLGRLRAECKPCTIRKNTTYQQKTKAWRYRFVDKEETKSYMSDYYERHRDQFIEYRRLFNLRYPNYHKHYYESRKHST